MSRKECLFAFFLFLTVWTVGDCSSQEIIVLPQSTPPVPVLPKSSKPSARRDWYVAQPIQVTQPIQTVAAITEINSTDSVIDTKSDSPQAWTLDQVISAVLTSDPKLRIGKEDIRQAQAEYCTSSLLPNPEFTVEGGAFPFIPIEKGEYWGGPPELNFQVEFSIDWFLFAKRKAAMNSARWDVCQAQAEYADLIRERITEAATTFYDVLEAKAILSVSREDLELLIQLEKIAKNGVEAGGIPVVEWKRINLDVLQCRQELLEAEKTLDILKAQLRSLFGCVDYDPNFDITGGLNAPTVLAPMLLEEAFAMAQQNRPDIRALRIGVSKAKADILMEKRNAYPEVTAFAGTGREYSKLAGEDKDYNNWGIGLTVSVPLFDRNQGNKARARSAFVQSNHRYQAGIVELHAEIVEADRNFRTAQKQSHIFAKEEVRLAKEVRDIMVEGFRAGGRPLIDVLDAERSYRETVRLFVTSRADYWRALYTYNSVVGIDSINNVHSITH
ncbi:MAG: TolC family protein [Planctomycetaceae bacterium]|nr:TolC family protein [Planctomycetaceae bacterium]